MTACQGSGAASDSARSNGPAEKSPAAAASPAGGERAENLPLIVALGDSLTAGYGLEPQQGWTAQLQQRLDEKGLRYRVVNKGVSGDTSRGGLSRVEDALEGDVRVLILALGGNDLLRGQQTAELKNNLAQIIERAQARNIRVILAGMEAPPNLGDDYMREFRNVYRDLAREYKVELIPFFLAGVGGIADMNLPDGIHPNARGQQVVLENVWQELAPMVE